ncbi:MAG TPA: LLM class F420-dependent oxidoreductase [Acidimicrobiales bacterium]|nr:LLM class F420-dependent oxidoreductase [Acidimicrobiales bacterium]
MKFGISFVNGSEGADPDYAVGLAQTAENYGFESLFTAEHLVVPVGYESRYPYSADGRMVFSDDTPLAECLLWLAYVACATSRINLGTGVLVLPQRQPLLLAKELATLDRLAPGRVLLGVGVGWLEEEFTAFGLPYADRARRTDEYVSTLRTLWGPQPCEFHGDFTNFDPLYCAPTPSDARAIKILVGGHSKAAARRAGLLGDGYFPIGLANDVFAERIALMRATADEAGRDPLSIEVTTIDSWKPAAVESAAALGVDRYLVIRPSGPLSRVEDRIGDFSQAVMADHADPPVAR